MKIIAGQGEEKRANSLANILTGNWQILDEKQVNMYTPRGIGGEIDTSAFSRLKLNREYDSVRLLPDSCRFTIINLYHGIYRSEWALSLFNENDSLIMEWRGEGPPDDEIVWDWKLSEDLIITPGNYYFFIRWIDSNGIWQRSFREYLQVAHTKKVLSLEITQKPRDLRRGIEDFRLILNRKRY